MVSVWFHRTSSQEGTATVQIFLCSFLVHPTTQLAKKEHSVSSHAPTLIVKGVLKHFLKKATQNEMKLTYCGWINRHTIPCNKVQISISDFRQEVKTAALFCDYTHRSGNSLPTFRTSRNKYVVPKLV